MTKTLTFLHTSPVHVATFDRLLAELAPDIPAKHLVDVQLLDDARAFGITQELSDQVKHSVAEAIADGAAVIVCTCSTIGGCVEQAQQAGGPAVMRIDRPMAEQAVATGSRIIIAAALSSTLAPTRQLLLDAARDAGKDVSLIEVLCDDAWSSFERGDHETYFATIARSLQQAAPEGDVIVLAQASMAGAVAYCPNLPIPVLSSPRLGLEAALRTYRDNVQE